MHVVKSQENNTQHTTRNIMTDYQFLDRDIALSCIDELIVLLSSSLLSTTTTLNDDNDNSNGSRSINNDDNEEHENNQIHHQEDAKGQVGGGEAGKVDNEYDDSLNQNTNVPFLLLDRCLDKIRTIFDKYLECPTLLDGSISLIVQTISKPILIGMNQLLQHDDENTHKIGYDNSSSVTEMMAKMANFMDLGFYLEELTGRKIEIVTPQSLNKFIGKYITQEVEYVSLAA